MKRFIALSLAVAAFTTAAFAQTTPDPAVQEARAKLEVVYDLGRVFGYIHTMDKDSKKTPVTAAQAKSLVAIADKVLAAKRLEPKAAEALLTEIEDKVLTPAQLMRVDELALAREASSTAGTGTGPGATGGTSPVQSYLSGGPFNPMLDTTRTIGKDFKAAYDYLKAKK